uniref:Phospholipid-transporting ATPase n=1 Tax=Eptatretus burgeri TaxID=7764 RepID=A0A8C4QUV2_EPTBU
MRFRKAKAAEEQRTIKTNNQEFNEQFEYANNSIKTSKYNVITFLPINLFEQFQRVANAYFLFLLILQLIPEISSLSWFTTVVPLVFVLIVTAVKDASDDYFRYRSDNQVNNRRAEILHDGQFMEDKWMNVQVGDIIKMKNNQFVPADLLLLSSSEPHSLSYIETAELDGETNLKVRQALPVTSDIGDDVHDLSTFDGQVICEPPNNRLDKFTGTLFFADNKYALDNDKILLRGCVLRNTEWCHGLVIFAGQDTKLMQNSGKTQWKRTNIDRLMNTLVLWIFSFLIFMGIVLAVGNTIWESQIGFDFQHFLSMDSIGPDSAFFSGFLTFWSYIIILNTVVPISLYVSVEVIRLCHSYFVNWDLRMYYKAKEMPAQVRTTTLNEELGQIEYVFSDKTGTLTQNIMAFNKCSIDGQLYGELYDKNGQLVEINAQTPAVNFLSWNPLADQKFQFYDEKLPLAMREENETAHEFFRLLALCHTVMAEEKHAGDLVYQAQSPDEDALVTAARCFGFVFRSRTPDTITVDEFGDVRTYKLLSILDFNNVRKRMSVIVRNPEGKIKLYCKGADTIIFDLLHEDCRELTLKTTEHLNMFAGEGLRTLCLAYKDLDEADFAEWSRRHHEASTAMDEREEKLSAVYEEIEKDMKLLGATAIEDKLQDGVPDAIANLARANIKLWVLTGDKQETAVNIGYSCNMLWDDMEMFIVSGHLEQEVRAEIENAMKKIIEVEHFETVPNKTRPIAEYALVINGHSLAFALQKTMEMQFLELACLCKAVICCRVTPLQKAQVVDLVKQNKKSITLAIGDGANDVNMIKTAHIGVGISGQEGMQAVLASDFSFGQFRYLQRLLLVHGRWSYLRMCKFLCYFFYKNFAFTLVHFWFAFFCGFSAQTVYDQWFITLYNIVYTSLPVLAMGCFDQDVKEQWSLVYPKLYSPGQFNRLFNKKQFFICTSRGIYTSIVLFFVPYAMLCTTMRMNGSELADGQSLAVIVSTALVIVVSLQVGIDMAYWTPINQIFVWGSIAMYFAITFALYSDGMYTILPGAFPFIGASRAPLSQPTVCLTVLLTVVICMVPVIVSRFIHNDLHPTLSDMVRVLQVQEGRRPEPRRRKPIRRVSMRRSGYAFAHTSGFGKLIMSGQSFRAPARRTAKSPKLHHQPSDLERVHEEGPQLV